MLTWSCNEVVGREDETTDLANKWDAWEARHVNSGRSRTKGTVLRCSAQALGVPRRDKGKLPSVYDRRRQILELYTNWTLTYQTDLLPAISGIAAIIQRITGDVHIARLWKWDIAYGLCWRNKNGKIVPNKDYIAPSFSWACMLGKVVHPDLQGHIYDITMVDHIVSVGPLNPFGEVQHVSLIVTGPIRQVRLPLSRVSPTLDEQSRKIVLENTGMVKSEKEEDTRMSCQVK
jgi:hypothetical protein